jgi:multiple antibiotic resistance protein
MVRIVGGIILMKIGFELFSSSPSGGGMIPAGGAGQDANIAFVLNGRSHSKNCRDRPGPEH